jgi:hypothetical protein
MIGYTSHRCICGLMGQFWSKKMLIYLSFFLLLNARNVLLIAFLLLLLLLRLCLLLVRVRERIYYRSMNTIKAVRPYAQRKQSLVSELVGWSNWSTYGYVYIYIYTLVHSPNKSKCTPFYLQFVF